MKAVGTNTAISTSEIAITAVPTSSMVTWAAWRGVMPFARLRSTFSTTTMASSTTIPIASTRPKSVSMFKEKPKASRKANVPISETGMATIGMIAVRQDCRKTRTTMATNIAASAIVL
jgi:hypothetical protein